MTKNFLKLTSLQAFLLHLHRLPRKSSITISVFQARKLNKIKEKNQLFNTDLSLESLEFISSRVMNLTT